MKPWLKISIWSAFALTVIILLVATQNAQDNIVLDAPEVQIHVKGDAHFITEKEVLEELEFQHLWKKGQTAGSLNVERIEAYLNGISQVKKVKVFRKLGGHWKIEIVTRRPVARIYNRYGETFYLDDEGMVMEVSSQHVARVLVVTGDIADRKDGENVPVIINNDSLKSIRNLDDIYRISNYVCNDPLFHSLIGQIYLEKNGDFVLIPMVGDQKIVFGSAFTEEEVKRKFKKLKVFYNEAIPYEGWDVYTEISLKYKDQIVCKKKTTDG